jgi:hypothetical protein
MVTMQNSEVMHDKFITCLTTLWKHYTADDDVWHLVPSMSIAWAQLTLKISPGTMNLTVPRQQEYTQVMSAL